MTMRMQFCLKAVTSLDDQDVDALADAIQSYRSAGMSDSESEVAAVNDLIAGVREEREALLAAIREQIKPEARELATKADFTKEGITGIMKKDGWAILTAENPRNEEPAADPEAADRANSRRTDELREFLDEAGIEYMEVRGRYSEGERPEERSFVIFAPREKALSIGDRFGQESILTSAGLEYMDGRKDKATGKVEVFSRAPENYYSRILGADWAFRVEIDFDSQLLPSIDNEHIVNDHGARWEDVEEAIGVKMPAPQRNVSAARRLYFGQFDLRGQERDETGRQTVAEVAGLVYRRALRAFRGKTKREFTPQNMEFIAKVLAADALLELKLNPDKNGAQWYREDMERAVAEAAKLYPEIAEPNGRLMFTLALAITSNGTTIRENVGYAFAQYARFRRTGRFPTGFEWGGPRRSTMAKQFALANNMLDRFRGNESELRAYVFSKARAGDVAAEFGTFDEDTGELLKKKSIPENVDELVYRSTAFGPKVGGAFWPALNGVGDVVTMDRWFMRTWGRITGTGLKTDDAGGLILRDGFAQMQDVPRGAGQRAFIRKTMARATELVNEQGYDFRMIDLQALLWYVEKRYYQSFGAADSRGAPTDYSVEVKEYVQKHRKTHQGGGAVAGARPRRGVDRGDRTAEQAALFASLPEPEGAAVRPGREGSVSVVGFHYGAVPGLTFLSGHRFGSHTRGAEQKRLAWASDPRIKKRVYFYIVQPGQPNLPRREAGVGTNAYVARLYNLYESGVSPKLSYDSGTGAEDRANRFESAVLDAGYDGYIARSHGVAVVLNRDVPVRELGNIGTKRIAVPSVREQDAADQADFLAREAKARGFASVDAMAIAEPATFIELAKRWRASAPDALAPPDTTNPDILASIDDALDNFGDPDEQFDDSDYRDFLMPDVEADIEALGRPQNTEQLAEDVRQDMTDLRSNRRYSIYEIARIGRDWLTLAAERRGFAYPFSSSTDLATVAKEMSNGTVSVQTGKPDAIEASLMKSPSAIEAMRAMGIGRSKMVKRHALTMRLTPKQAEQMGQKYAGANVYELENGTVFLNIVLFEAGVTNGNLIYQIVGTWAANAGKKFVGDPAGLSERALFRRTENMLANALRTGTTRHLIPHPYQRNAGLDWMPGDDEYNVGSMALWARDAIELYSPKQWNIINSVLKGERPASMQRAVPDVVADAEGYADSGRRTTARAAITESIQRGINTGAAEFVPGGFETNLEGRIEPKVIEGEIMYSLPTTMGEINGLVADMFKTESRVSWWDRTVGTQYAKAQKNPLFGEVYKKSQQFLNDTSFFANAATDFAPDVLPKMEHWTHALRGIGKDFTGERTANLKAASRALFDGTIEDRVWTDLELVARGMTPQQIGMYRQMRRAINTSLDQLAVSEMHRLTRNMGLDEARKRIIGMSADRARSFLLQEIAALPRFNQQQQEALEFVRKEINAKANKIEGLKATGYAPLMRFGRYAVEFNLDGERNFMLFETEFERNRFVRELKKEPDASGIATGTMSERSFELFRGMDPNALELFGEVATLDYIDASGNLQKVNLKDEPLFQQYLKLAVSSRSAMKRLIKRKKVAGYDENGTRVLAQFVVSNARTASRNLHLADMISAANNIPKEQGDLRDEAIGLVKYLQDPVEEASKLRGFLFFHFLGGSIASALVNMTQPIMMTFPFLSQWGTTNAFAALSRGMRQAVGRNPGGALGAGLRLAEEQGIVSPQEIHTLYAEASRSLTSDVRVRRALLLWGSLFSAAEQFNRRATFIAAWDIATQLGQTKLTNMGFGSAYDFAVHAVAETQGTYNKGNRPNWARGAVGATIFTFKQYSIHYLEWWGRLPRQQKVLAMAMLVLVSGLQGLPFADDLDDLLDSMAQALGYAWNTKDKKRELVASVIGKTGAEIVMSGLSGLPGVPLDIQGRMSMGNLIPGTGMFKRSSVDPGRDALEVLGPAGSLAQGAIEGAKELLAGNVSGAAPLVLPIAVRNILKGQDMIQTGAYRDTRGRTIVQTDTADAITKIIGFQPSSVAKATRAERSVQELVQMTRDVKSDLSERWAEGIFKNDPAMVASARADLMEWNLSNPEFPIVIRMQDVMRRVKDKRLTRAERIEKAAPKAIRKEVGLRLEGA